MERLEIARLSNLEAWEIDNVNEDHVNCVQPKDKAAGILNLINSKPNFNRERLADNVKEAGLHDVAEEILKGTLRDQSPDDTSSPDASSVDVQK